MVYLIPTVLAEGAFQTIPAYVMKAVQQCTVFFVENERTARRFLKRIWREMVIDDYRWYTIHKAEAAVMDAFVQQLREGAVIGIISEAGCPGIADPGQLLVARAQEMNIPVRPLVGPSSILLSLMASGLNGQSFRFHGYLPIEASQRKRALLQLEEEAVKNGTTQLFIETPYRNDALLKEILNTCRPSTRLCLAADLTGPGEQVMTRRIKDWKQSVPVLHKIPVIFLLGSERNPENG